MRKWIASIKKDEPLKIVEGTYGKWAYDFVPPESDRGKALSMGLRGVPALLGMLDVNTLNTRQRAEVLCLLFSAAGENDPQRSEGVLADCEYQEGPWAIAAQGNVIGMGWSGVGSTSGGKIDDVKQKAFAECWRPWNKYMQVEKN